jgi:hypothetical protein
MVSQKIAGNANVAVANGGVLLGRGGDATTE